MPVNGSNVCPTVDPNKYNTFVTATLTYLNNRYYDPVLGRFISVDPLDSVTRDE